MAPPARPVINFKKFTVPDLKIDQASAQKYVATRGVGGAGVGRTVSLYIDADVTPNSVQLSKAGPDGMPVATFQGKFDKVTVLSNMRVPIGMLAQQ